MSKPIVRKTVSAVVALSTVALLSGTIGCGIGPVAPSGPIAQPGVQINGIVHGGQQPVVGAVINLYEAGATAGTQYGMGAKALISSTVKTDSNGAFSITGDYTCPSSSTLVYLTASGGNPGLATGTDNTALELAAPLGACGNLSSSTSIFVDEVTTAATAVALGQYFMPNFTASSGGTDGFGAPSTTQAQLGLTNAFATVNNLVNTTTGNAVTSATLTGAGNTITTTPESAKLYTIADILAACVNSTGGASGDGSSCGTLFADVTPTGGTAPTDTLQAAVDMQLNPTSNNSNGSSANLTALYDLTSATSPYPAGPQPTDWTVGIQYTDSGASQTFFLDPQNIAIDSLGNVWVLSQNSNLGALVEVSPTGTPESDISTLDQDGPYSTPVANPPVITSPKTTTTTFGSESYIFTTTFGQTANNPGISPRNVAIDPSNNVWFTTTTGASSPTGGSNGTTTVGVSGAVFEVATSAGLPTGSTYGFSTGKSAYGLAIDGMGDVFAGDQSSSAYFSVYEFPYNATPGAGLLTPITYPTIDTVLEPEYMAFDPSGNLWMTNAASPATNSTERLSNISLSGALIGAGNPTPTSCTAPTNDTLCQAQTSSTANIYTNYTLASGDDPWGLAADTNGIFIPDGGNNGVNYVTYASPTSNTFIQGAAPGDAFTTPHYAAVDGAGNVWVSNKNTTPNGGSVSELSSTGAILSPTVAGTVTSPGFTHSGLNSGLGIAIDPSGNVWVANNVAPTAGTTPVGASIFEIVGAAAPTVTPIALSLANSAVGVKP